MDTIGKGNVMQIHIRVHPDVYAKLQTEARRQHRRSVNDLMYAAAMELIEQPAAQLPWEG